jgi:hypothetical protein
VSSDEDIVAEKNIARTQPCEKNSKIDLAKQETKDYM